MRISVARRYEFAAEHHVPHLDPPWCEPHTHDYTVEVVATGPLTDGIVIDTDRLDALWESMAPSLDPDALPDLNDQFEDTTVEGLAALWLGTFRLAFPQVESVTVWEDTRRWGRAGAAG